MSDRLLGKLSCDLSRTARKRPHQPELSLGDYLGMANVQRQRRPPIKVALLCTPTDFGGAERVILTLLEHVARSEFDLIPVVFMRDDPHDNPFLAKAKQLGIACHVLTLNKYKLKYWNPFVNLIEAYRLFKYLDVDVIHTHGYRADAIGLAIAKRTRTPIIATCHGYISSDNLLAFYVAIDRLALRYFSKVIAVSESIKADLVQHAIDNRRISVIPNSVAVPVEEKSLAVKRATIRRSLALQENELLIGYVGRLSLEKGVSYLIEAAALLLHQGLQFRVLILGNGPQKPDLEDLVSRHKLRERVVFVGFQSNIHDWLPALDIFVLPSLTEGTPMALLEAMAYGLPAVASSVGGVPEVVISKQNGILLPPGDPEAIKTAVQDLARSPSLRMSLGLNARNTIRQRYGIQDWVKKIETQYLSMLSIGKS